jgi:hypothetical protein
MSTPEILLWSLAAVLVIVGTLGILLPAIPGSPLVLGGLIAAAAADDFEYVGFWTLAVLTLMAAMTYAVDFIAGAAGAKQFGASKRAVIGAAIGALLGAVGAVVGLVAGLPGLVLGPFIGAVVGELSQHGNLRQAGWAGLGATLGLALGAAVKLALIFSMIGVFGFVRFIADA